MPMPLRVSAGAVPGTVTLVPRQHAESAKVRMQSRCHRQDQSVQVLLRFGYKLPAPLRLLARNPAW
jgi:hypothetical protein